MGFSSRPGRFRRGGKRGRFVEGDRRIGLELDLAGGHHALARPGGNAPAVTKSP
jgi:hypothetical protein